jgi:hypothetical protein
MPEQLSLAPQFEESEPSALNPEDFSPLLREISRLIGDEKTFALAQHFGGTHLYIPSQIETLGPDHPITRAIGAEAAAKLSKDYGGLTFRMPRACKILRAARYARIRERAKTATKKQLAREFGLTYQFVWMVLNNKQRGT